MVSLGEFSCPCGGGGNENENGNACVLVQTAGCGAWVKVSAVVGGACSALSVAVRVNVHGALER